MSDISDHDLEHLARLLMQGDERDLFPEIVRVLWMDDDTCDALPEARSTDPQSRH
jgi:hypothetical protein